jgi:tRNA threonylcarbamoyl adenosine modification protein (Sua5/YciO/YrdC/YwlC family)
VHAVALLLEIERSHMNPRSVAEAIRAFERGEVVAYATDTIYGFGCDLRNARGVERLYRIRRMDRSRPLAVLFGSLGDIGRYAQVSNSAYRIMRRLFPGPYTVELEATREVPRSVTERRRRIGVRVPDEPVIQAILHGLGRPIISTSAKSPEGELLLTAADIERTLGDEIDLIVDSGPVPGQPSTVLSLVDEQIEVIREGLGPIDRISG